MRVEIFNEDYAERNSVFSQAVIGEGVTLFAALFTYPFDTRKLVATVETVQDGRSYFDG